MNNHVGFFFLCHGCSLAMVEEKVNEDSSVHFEYILTNIEQIK